MAKSHPARRYRQNVIAEPRVLAGLRVSTAAHLRLWGYDALVDSVVLVLSEMLTNVVRHARTPSCVLVLEDLGGAVRLTVSDGNTQVPVPRCPDWQAESGRGMFLIAASATSFGATVTSAGKDVWAVFRDDVRAAA
jgi:anti-sigma regulatory factor (Ser/Thr protein kinase)